MAVVSVNLNDWVVHAARWYLVFNIALYFAMPCWDIRLAPRFHSQRARSAGWLDVTLSRPQPIFRWVYCPRYWIGCSVGCDWRHFAGLGILWGTCVSADSEEDTSQSIHSGVIHPFKWVRALIHTTFQTRLGKTFSNPIRFWKGSIFQTLSLHGSLPANR